MGGRVLVALEGEYDAFFDTEEDAFQYIEQKAEEMRQRGVLEVDEWVEDFKNYYFSLRHTNYPEFIYFLDVDMTRMC